MLAKGGHFEHFNANCDMIHMNIIDLDCFKMLVKVHFFVQITCVVNFKKASLINYFS